MASARKGFQGFVDPNGKDLDFFETLERMKKITKPPKQGVSGKSGKSGYVGVTGITGNYGSMTSETKKFADTIYSPPVEEPKQKNKIVFNIEKIN